MILLPHRWLSTSWKTLREVYSEWEVDWIFEKNQIFAHVLSKLQAVVKNDVSAKVSLHEQKVFWCLNSCVTVSPSCSSFPFSPLSLPSIILFQFLHLSFPSPPFLLFISLSSLLCAFSLIASFLYLHSWKPRTWFVLSTCRNTEWCT